MALLAYSLTTLDRVKDFGGLSGLSAAQDAVLTNIINAATTYIESHTERRFMQTAYSNELYDGHGDERLILDQFPVDSSASFSFEGRDTTENDDDWTTIDSDQYFVDYSAGIIFTAGRWSLANIRYGYRVTYTAGYDFDNSSTFLSDTAAAEVEYVAWKLVMEAWADRKSGKTVKGERLGDYAITFGKSLFDVSTAEDGTGGNSLKSILDKYRRADDLVASVLTPRNS